jgi:SpoVK/Ycf46/Vps4 family AAA+-type ATPase
MNAQLLKALVRAHTTGDERAFRKAALQLAATESEAGHTRIADELRELIAALPPVLPNSPAARIDSVDISSPRGDLGNLLTGGFRDERLGDIILSSETSRRLHRVLRENRQRIDLENFGMSPSRRLLFYGPPGCGKTLAAQVLAGELGVPLMTVRFDGLFSRFLGATAGHLKTIFDEMPRRPAVYLFDEFDAVGKFRGDTNEVGEIRRVVTSFLQLMDADKSGSIIVAATNYDELLDRAVFRRFDVLLHFGKPAAKAVERLLRLRLRAFRIPATVVSSIARQAHGFSYADAARASDDAVRSMVLDRRTVLRIEDLRAAFKDTQSRIDRGD